MSAFTAEQEKVLKGWTQRYPASIMGLVEALRQVQEWHRCVTDEDEEYLAKLFDVPRRRIHEVATFFPSFTQKPAGRHRIGICRGLSCSLAGSQSMCACLEKKLGIKEGETSADGRFSLEAMECLGACDHGPALLVNDELKGAATEESVSRLLEELQMTKLLTQHFGEPKLHELETYRRLGGYEGLKKALSMGREALLAEVNKSNLRGLGGAGFGAAMKWSTVPPESKNPGPRYVVVNCDESEPGCFKDRVLVTRAPHQLIEGLLIAAHAIEARRTFIFIRGEYEVQHRILRQALDEVRAAGLMGECSIDLMRGGGAYISGLDTALLETMEGKKAWPRQPPPFPTVSGLMGRPTVVNNVETLSMIPHIVMRGGEWFAALGTAKSGGTVLFSVSGHVVDPGVYEFPMGTPLREILAAAGGVKGGRKLKAVIPGGVSTPVMTADELDTPMDFEGPRAKGTFLGAGGVIVLDETVDMVMVAHNIERFLAHESCGQCTPCRQGSFWHERILERGLSGGGSAEDLATLERAGENITGKVICALGDTVGVVTRALLKKFPEDFKARFPEPGGASRHG